MWSSGIQSSSGGGRCYDWYRSQRRKVRAAPAGGVSHSRGSTAFSSKNASVTGVGGHTQNSCRLTAGSRVRGLPDQSRVLARDLLVTCLRNSEGVAVNWAADRYPHVGGVAPFPPAACRPR